MLGSCEIFQRAQSSVIKQHTLVYYNLLKQILYILVYQKSQHSSPDLKGLLGSFPPPPRRKVALQGLLALAQQKRSAWHDSYLGDCYSIRDLSGFWDLGPRLFEVILGSRILGAGALRLEVRV